jgi:hypothetical protein
MTFNPEGVVVSETTSPVYGVAEQPTKRAAREMIDRLRYIAVSLKE